MGTNTIIKFKDLIIINEDGNYIAISKPSGLLSIPDRFNDGLTNLYHLLKSEFGEILIVHRLDRDTSGIILFAKNIESHRYLNTLFQERQIKRVYHVVLEGIVRQDEMEIDIPLIEDLKIKGKMKPHSKGKPSLSKLKVIDRFRNSTLAEITLVTGRHHQIRAHCSSIGHPLLIDPLYGNHHDFFVSSVKRKFNLAKKTIENPLISRITMHAYSLAFTTLDNKQVDLKSEYPKDFKALIQVLSKYST